MTLSHWNRAEDTITLDYSRRHYHFGTEQTTLSSHQNRADDTITYEQSRRQYHIVAELTTTSDFTIKLKQSRRHYHIGTELTTLPISENLVWWANVKVTNAILI